MKRRAAPPDIMSASESIARSEHTVQCYLGTHYATFRFSGAADALVWCFTVWGQHEIAELWLINTVLTAGGH